jgi:spore coat polysaccharide biosynthesis protein SpsF
MPNVGNRQEQLWRGHFGDAYTGRNALSDARLAALGALWTAILRPIMGAPPGSVLEVGANIGLNLRALIRLTGADLYALEPNRGARERLVADGIVPRERALDGLCDAIPLPSTSIDLVFTSGVLIHIHPDRLFASCREVHRVSSRYIACIEYFSDKPQQILYRDQPDALFKRDFGAFYLDSFPDLRVLDCGFAWKRTTGLDNLTWWLLEKRP